MGALNRKTGLVFDPALEECTVKGLIIVNWIKQAIVGATTHQVIALGSVRFNAWFMYPALVTELLSKFRVQQRRVIFWVDSILRVNGRGSA
jgi:hypothetical protein